jgi:hypothetical protein
VDSTFRVGGLPPGDYFIVAYPNGVADARVDAVVLDVLAAIAGRISIVSGEKRRVDVTLTSPADIGDVSGAGARFSGNWTLGNSPGLSSAAYEGNANSFAGQLQVGPGTGKLVISQRGDRLRIESHATATGAKETVEYGLNGQPVRNPFSLGPRAAPPPSEITSWLQGNQLVLLRLTCFCPVNLFRFTTSKRCRSVLRHPGRAN